jgi:hypothetical protein
LIQEHWAACWQNRSSSSFLWAWETEGHRWGFPLNQKELQPERATQPLAAIKGLLAPDPARVEAQPQAAGLLLVGHQLPHPLQPHDHHPLTPLILNARAWFTGKPAQLLLVWLVYRLAMPILIERMSA